MTDFLLLTKNSVVPRFHCTVSRLLDYIPEITRSAQEERFYKGDVSSYARNWKGPEEAGGTSNCSESVANQALRSEISFAEQFGYLGTAGFWISQVPSRTVPSIPEPKPTTGRFPVC